MNRIVAAAFAALLAASPAAAAAKVEIMVGGSDKQIYLPAKLLVTLLENQLLSWRPEQRPHD